MSDYPANAILFNIVGQPSAFVSNELDNRDICVRSGFHCSPMAHKLLKTGDGGAVRVGFGTFNTQKDIYSLFDALNDIISSKKI
jgi:selenocysteine lyase/cysteine desulfurase